MWSKPQSSNSVHSPQQPQAELPVITSHDEAPARHLDPIKAAVIESCIHQNTSDASKEPENLKPPFTFLGNDPGYWSEYISDKDRCDFVELGPTQVEVEFPYNGNRRRCSKAHYSRVMPNGEKICRKWLIYSTTKDAVFCFCCKLFGNGDSPFCKGTNTWEGLSKNLRYHENGEMHQKCLSKWIELRE